MDLTVVLPAKGEGPNLKLLLPALRQVTSGLGLSTEIRWTPPAAGALCEAVARESGARHPTGNARIRWCAETRIRSGCGRLDSDHGCRPVASAGLRRRPVVGEATR